MWEVYREQAGCSCCVHSPSVVVATEDDAKKVVAFLGGESYYTQAWIPEPVDVAQWIQEQQAHRDYVAAYDRYSEEYLLGNPVPTVKEWAKSALVDGEPVEMLRWNDDERFPDSEDNTSHFSELDWDERQAYYEFRAPMDLAERAYVLQKLREEGITE